MRFGQYILPKFSDVFLTASECGGPLYEDVTECYNGYLSALHEGDYVRAEKVARAFLSYVLEEKRK